jgi:cytochrome c oxidase subunit 2
MAQIIKSFSISQLLTYRVNFTHHTLLEKIWTYTPALILLAIAAPSFSLLYSIDELTEPKMTVKVIGHQWYWSYELTDLVSKEAVCFDSYMLLAGDLKKGGMRLLEVDNRLVLPVRTNIRALLSAADVLHSWAIPSFGVKMDCCPGRLNQVSLSLDRAGVFYGQCSELCGVNHSFMPICVEVVTLEQYAQWLKELSATEDSSFSKPNFLAPVNGGTDSFTFTTDSPSTPPPYYALIWPFRHQDRHRWLYNLTPGAYWRAYVARRIILALLFRHIWHTLRISPELKEFLTYCPNRELAVLFIQIGDEICTVISYIFSPWIKVGEYLGRFIVEWPFPTIVGAFLLVFLTPLITILLVVLYTELKLKWRNRRQRRL